ncbi:helix-turn-helix domain-containing protein [Opitutaceae bacterium TAV4]|nr:helix-turn-helix domain-containing protein [Opitutaceae bacterium TAV4]RRJ99680.1 helix-turn-helix domain-containing protein [Opitutaceae bacterium TAV3]
MRVLAHFTWSCAKLEYGVRAYARDANWVLSINRHANELPPVSPDVDGVLLLVGEDFLFDARCYFPNAKSVDLRGIYEPRMVDGITMIDHEKVGCVAADYLYEIGRRNVLAFGGNPNLEFRAQIGSFIKRSKAIGSKAAAIYTNQWAEGTATDHANLTEKIRRTIEELGLPLGVFSPDDMMADSFMQIALGLGYSVPAQIAVLGMNNDRGFCEMCRVPLSSLDVNLSRLGYDGARLLDRLMRGQIQEPLPRVIVPPLTVETRQSTDHTRCDDRLVVAILEYIRDHFAEHMTVEDMLRDLHTSRAVAYERFQKHIGHPIGEEIERVRMNYARGLLVGSDYKIDVVARMSGYQNTASFGRAFKTRFGETPNAARRRGQE